MSEASEGPPAQTSRIEVTSDYVRERHALFVLGKFSPLYVDYYLHLMQHELKLEPDHDAPAQLGEPAVVRSEPVRLAGWLGASPQ